MNVRVLGANLLTVRVQLLSTLDLAGSKLGEQDSGWRRKRHHRIPLDGGKMDWVTTTSIERRWS